MLGGATLTDLTCAERSRRAEVRVPDHPRSLIHLPRSREFELWVQKEPNRGWLWPMFRLQRFVFEPNGSNDRKREKMASSRKTFCRLPSLVLPSTLATSRTSSCLEQHPLHRPHLPLLRVARPCARKGSLPDDARARTPPARSSGKTF